MAGMAGRSEAVDDAEQAEWSAVCLRWFGSSDPLAAAALSFFEEHCSPSFSGGGAPPAPAQAPAQAAGLAALLRATGLTDAVGCPLRLAAERHAAYVAARNAARREAHRQLGAARRARLAGLLARTAQPLVRGAASEAGGVPLLALGRFEDVRPCEAAFVARHTGAIGTHPFMKGLRALLQQQVGDPTVWQWSFADDVLIEAGDDKFMEQAVELLSHALQRVPVSDDDCEGGQAGRGVLSWQVAPQTSDRHIRRFLSLLPVDSRLEGRPTGGLNKTAALRTNMRGELDEDRALCLDGSLLRCSLL